MKKYLMGGIAAVAICAAFTSCSKNNELFDQNAAEQAKQQTSEQKIISDYQTAFENAFRQTIPQIRTGVWVSMVASTRLAHVPSRI